MLGEISTSNKAGKNSNFCLFSALPHDADMEMDIGSAIYACCMIKMHMEIIRNGHSENTLGHAVGEKTFDSTCVTKATMTALGYKPDHTYCILK